MIAVDLYSNQPAKALRWDSLYIVLFHFTANKWGWAARWSSLALRCTTAAQRLLVESISSIPPSPTEPLAKYVFFLFVHLQVGLCNWWITSGPSVQYLGVKLQNLLWLLTYVCACVSTSQCFNKLTRDATEAAKVELLSPEMACHRWNERNTGGMPKPQESLCCLWVGRVYLCVFVRIFPSPIFSSALSPLEEAIFNQWCRERHFTSLPIKFHHQGRHHFDKWCLVFVELYLPQWPEKAVKVVIFSKVYKRWRELGVSSFKPQLRSQWVGWYSWYSRW